MKDDPNSVTARTVDLKAVLDQAEGYRVPAQKPEAGERERIVELYVIIAEELEAMIDN